MKLHLGVIDMPYSNPNKGYKKHKSHKRNEALKSEEQKIETTGSVAEDLEVRYHIMAIFFAWKQNKIADSMAETMAHALESVLMGGPVQEKPSSLLGSTESMIDTEFKQFLSSQEAEVVLTSFGIDGVPTKAALDGINHRFKNPITGIRRPSFIDTGLYQATFKSWFDE
jgi:hypothetical protein